jgi:hypothetical protein
MILTSVSPSGFTLMVLLQTRLPRQGMTATQMILSIGVVVAVCALLRLHDPQAWMLIARPVCLALVGLSRRGWHLLKQV